MNIEKIDNGQTLRFVAPRHTAYVLREDDGSVVGFEISDHESMHNELWLEVEFLDELISLLHRLKEHCNEIQNRV